MPWRLPSLRSPALWLSLGLCLTIVVDLAHLGRALSARTPAVVPLPAVSVSVRSRANLAFEITRAHLFGISPRPIETAGTETPRPLLLSGILATSDPRMGHAIIAEQGEAAHVYQVGALVLKMPQAHLAQIFADHVQLDFGDHTETLRLPRSPSAGGAPVLPTFAGVVPYEQTVAWAQESNTTVVHPKIVVTPAETAFDGLHLERPPTGGMRIYPEPRVQRRFGLRTGDVLVSVNGVNNPSAEMLQSVLEAAPQSLSLVVMRDGASVVINIPADD